MSQIDGHIEVKVRNAQQLFDARDPAPFRERDLDDNFIEYLMAWADELSRKIPWRLTIHIAEKQSESINSTELSQAIELFFNYQIELRRMQMKKTFKTAQFFLLIGLFVLFSCLAIATKVQFSPSYLFVREGIVILGWVAMWKPLELLLFDWWPIYDRIRSLQKLKEAKIEIHFDRPIP